MSILDWLLLGMFLLFGTSVGVFIVLIHRMVVVLCINMGVFTTLFYLLVRSKLLGGDE